MTDAPTPDSLRPGSLVGPWRVEGYVGRGSYGAVYRARRAGHPGSTPVALKVALFPHDPRFEREGELLSRFEHPAMPGLVDRGQWHASANAVHPYIVMEWVRGQPLYPWARMHSPSQRQVLKVLAQLAWGLEVLHRSGCLHRDIKGDNILVDSEGRAVFMDFGSGTWAGAPPLTQRIMAPGTHEYRSPEAHLFELGHWTDRKARYEARPADDIYALGVSMYRLLTGVYPPPPIAQEELEGAPVMPPPPRVPPQELNPRVGPKLAALVERMLARQPDARGSGRELAEAAESAAEHLGPEADVPLSSPERRAPEPVAVPVQVLPVPEPKRPKADVAPVPDRVPAESQAIFPAWRLVFMVAVMALTVVAVRWPAPEPRQEPLEFAQAEIPEAEEAPEAETTGLGDGGVTARAATQEAPIAAEVIATDMPKQPLPGQRRAPCRRGEVELRGGCWARWPDRSPPCGDEAYEWNGTCYLVLYEEPRRVPTTKKPR